MHPIPLTIADVPLAQAIICWAPGTSEVAVGPHPDRTGWPDCYTLAHDASRRLWRGIPLEKRLQLLLAVLMMITVRDRVPPEVVHAAFLVIPEYQDSLPDEMRARQQGQGESQRSD